MLTNVSCQTVSIHTLPKCIYANRNVINVCINIYVYIYDEILDLRLSYEYTKLNLSISMTRYFLRLKFRVNGLTYLRVTLFVDMDIVIAQTVHIYISTNKALDDDVSPLYKHAYMVCWPCWRALCTVYVYICI